jgi:hypothetical protein
MSVPLQMEIEIICTNFLDKHQKQVLRCDLFAKVFPFAMLLTLGILKTSFRLHSLTRNIASGSFLIATNLLGKAWAEENKDKN